MKELKYITLAQVIGCLLVIWGHSYPFVTEMPEAVVEGKGFVYLFHMPLFVFCSGFLLSYTNQAERKSFSDYIGQRAKKLLLPYLVFSLIGIAPKYLFSSVLNDSLSLDFMSLTRAFLVPRENIWGHFWFLPMIFFMGCIAYALDRYLIKKEVKGIGWGIVSIILIVLSHVYQPMDVMKWFGINDLALYGWSYTLGVECNYLFGDITEKVHFDRINTSLVCLVGGGISLAISLLRTNKDAPNLVVAILMIAVILLLCIAWNDKIRINRKRLIAQTYQIFILSWPCQLVVEIILERELHLQWWIILPSVFIIGVVGPLILIKLIDWFEAKTKTRILSVIIGK